MSLETYAQELGPDPTPRKRAAELSALGAIGAFWADRSSELLPTVEPSTALAYVLAVQQHAVIGNTETFAEVLRRTLDTDMLRADDITRCALYDQAAERGYLEPDNALYGVNPIRTEAMTTHARRVDGTVKGRRDAYVIGNNGDAGAIDAYGRMSAREAREHAALWLHTDTDGTADLIGTDEYSWSQVIDFRPVELELGQGVTLNGAPIGRVMFAPYGAGRSTTGENRRRIAQRVRRASYEHRPREVIDVATWGADGDSLRIVKRYRTMFDGRSVIGHGAWSEPSRRTRSKVTRAARASIPTLAAADALTLITEQLAAAYDTHAAATVRVRITGTAHTVTAQVEPTRRRYRVTVSTKGETGTTRASTTTHTLAAAAAYVRRHAA